MRLCIPQILWLGLAFGQVSFPSFLGTVTFKSIFIGHGPENTAVASIQAAPISDGDARIFGFPILSSLAAKSSSSLSEPRVRDEEQSDTAAFSTSPLSSTTSAAVNTNETPIVPVESIASSPTPSTALALSDAPTRSSLSRFTRSAPPIITSLTLPSAASRNASSMAYGAAIIGISLLGSTQSGDTSSANKLSGDTSASNPTEAMRSDSNPDLTGNGPSSTSGGASSVSMPTRTFSSEEKVESASALRCFTTTVPSCIQSCIRTLMTGGMMLTSCKMTSCSTVYSCSATPTTSTTYATDPPDNRCFWTGSSVALLPTEAPMLIACPAVPAMKKRSIEQPGDFEGGLAQFWANELGNAKQNNNILPHLGMPVQPGDIGGGISSSTSRIFGNQDFRFGAEGQRGCTTVWVLAKQGIWAAHFWETPAMGTIDLDENGETVEQDLEIFQPTVLDFISNGTTDFDFPGLSNFISNNKIGSDDILRVLLFSPVLPQGGFQYGNNLQLIQDKVAQLIPGGLSGKLYVLGCEKLGTSTLSGQILVQYDPDERRLGTPNNTAIARIWFEGSRIFPDMAWELLVPQRPSPPVGVAPLAGPGQRRDVTVQDTPDCTLPTQPTPTTFQTSTTMSHDSPVVESILAGVAGAASAVESLATVLSKSSAAAAATSITKKASAASSSLCCSATTFPLIGTSLI